MNQKPIREDRTCIYLQLLRHVASDNRCVALNGSFVTSQHLYQSDVSCSARSTILEDASEVTTGECLYQRNYLGREGDAAGKVNEDESDLEPTGLHV